jgi:predicted RNase H-like HicB family nuclease
VEVPIIDLEVVISTKEVSRGRTLIDMRKFPLTAVFEEVEEGWVQARVKEIPAVITAGPSRAEAEDLLFDALQEYVLSLGDGPEGAADSEAILEELTFQVSLSA